MFFQNYDFIGCLRKTTPDSLELLCDFASELENEGALEAVRFQSLLMIITSYSSLIHDDKNSSFDDIIKQINLVKKCELNKLAYKIQLISKEKKCLEDLKDSKSNAELNSIKQAEKRLSYGVFYLETAQKNYLENKYEIEEKKDFLTEYTFEDIIKLFVPKLNDKKTININHIIN